jgi:hypothetical protein
MKPRRLSPSERKAKRHSRRIPQTLKGKAVVDETRLAHNNSYDQPEFLKRGYYQDTPFTCRDCSKEEVWTASQQKWWFEIAKGDIFTQASRCRNCRRQERVRRNQARLVHLEGVATKRTKAQASAAGNNVLIQ